MTSDLIFIIGRQRSGTTAYRDFLTANGAYNADEIFHGDLDQPDKPDRFYAFVSEKMKEQKSFLLVERHRYLFELFIDRLREKANGKKIAMDVKYFALNFLPSPHLGARIPYIFEFIANKGASCVHIARANKLRMFISERLAETNGIWSASDRNSIPRDKSIRIDIDQAFTFVDSAVSDERSVSRMLGEVTFYHDFGYETMFNAEGNFSAPVVDSVCEMLNVQVIDPKPTHIQINPEPIEELVSNYEQLHNAFKNTRHRWMLKN